MCSPDPAVEMQGLLSLVFNSVMICTEGGSGAINRSNAEDVDGAHVPWGMSVFEIQAVAPITCATMYLYIDLLCPRRK